MLNLILPGANSFPLVVVGCNFRIWLLCIIHAITCLASQAMSPALR